ncbi:HEAT repeat domain-containing protein [candidate division KSB1 bacterium]|nr:HEAT repeat domain-containing protein [candidate division KSB1 bacterium]
MNNYFTIILTILATVTSISAGELLVDSLKYDELLAIAENTTLPQSFKAILRLREVGDERAVPILKQILIEHTNSTRIHRFGAAQALFCIGTDKAHQILREHLLDAEYPVDLSIMYGFHWRMEESKRDTFIAQHHLQNLSTDVSLKLEVKNGIFNSKIFTLILRNDSEKTLRLYKPKVYLGAYLMFRSSLGHFIEHIKAILYDERGRTPEGTYPKIAPGKDLKLSCSARPQTNRKIYKYPEPVSLVLDFGDTIHLLGNSGKFKVYAIYSYRKRPNELYPNIWTGRVVSNPVEIEILLE